MKTTRQTTILCLCAIVGAVVLLLFVASPFSETEKSVEKDEPTTKNRLSPSKVQTHGKVKINLDQYRRLLSNFSATNEIDDEDQTGNRLTDAEVAKRALRRQAVAPHFMKQAPTMLDDMIAEQQRNDLWTSVTEEEILGKLSTEEMKNTKLVNVGCYETMCKVTLNHQESADSKLFTEKATEGGNLDGPGHGFTKRLPDETIERTMYVGRYGEDHHIHDELYNRLYEKITGNSFDDLEPTADQIEQVAQQREKRRQQDEMERLPSQH